MKWKCDQNSNKNKEEFEKKKMKWICSNTGHMHLIEDNDQPESSKREDHESGCGTPNSMET